MLLLSVPFVLGWLLIGYAQNLAMMLIGRFIAGFCGGGFSLVAPVYIGKFFFKMKKKLTLFFIHLVINWYLNQVKLLRTMFEGL